VTVRLPKTEKDAQIATSLFLRGGALENCQPQIFILRASSRFFVDPHDLQSGPHLQHRSDSRCVACLRENPARPVNVKLAILF
jgi:hypothetical protein